MPEPADLNATNAADSVNIAGNGSSYAVSDHATFVAVANSQANDNLTVNLLGGGIGHLSRKYGLTIDSLLAADIVLADGSLVTASESAHEDLFQAIHGGGGSFGAVTSFKFKLHPVHTVLAGPMFWLLHDAPEVMLRYEEFITDASEDLNGFFAFMTVPRVPLFPESLHMKKVCSVSWCSTGDADATNSWLAPVQKWAKPLLAGVGPMPLPALQSLFDGLYAPGLQWYWTADFVNSLSEESITEHMKYASELPTMHSTMHLYPINGAVHRRSAAATAINCRSAKWAEVIVDVDPAPENAQQISRMRRS